MDKKNQYLIKYMTFDELLDEVRNDFESYEAEGMIDSSNLIKVVRTINKKLGLKIHKEREKMIVVENYTAKLPEDFYLLNFAFFVQSGSIAYSVPTNVTEFHQNRGALALDLLKLKATPDRYLNEGCPNHTGIPGLREISIQNDYIYTNFEEGEIYLNYTGDLVDEQNNVLVLDHPMVTDYYEYALKRRILENLYLDKGEDVVQKLNLIETRFRDARKSAHRFVDTPEFSEIQGIWLTNRMNYYRRYYYPITGGI